MIEPRYRRGFFSALWEHVPHSEELDSSFEVLRPEEMMDLVHSFRRQTIFFKLEEMDKQVELVRKQLEILQSGGKIIPVQHLDDTHVQLVRPFSVVVTACDDEYLCQFVDCNINASGETEFEAVENLKDIAVSLFKRLSTSPPSRLGPLPTKQLMVLTTFLRMETCDVDPKQRVGKQNCEETSRKT